MSKRAKRLLKISNINIKMFKFIQIHSETKRYHDLTIILDQRLVS